MSLSHRVMVRNGTRTHNLLIFGQTPKTSCLRAGQEDNFLPKVLTKQVQWIKAVQALRMPDALANFYICQISKSPGFGSGYRT